jgi:hypothetical protein
MQKISGDKFPWNPEILGTNPAISSREGVTKSQKSVAKMSRECQGPPINGMRMR